MLDAHVKALLHDAVADLLVNLDTQGGLGHVPHTAGAAMVELVGHTLLHGGVALNVNVIADLEDAQVGGHGNDTILAEPLRQKVAATRPDTMSTRHIDRVF
eukprot:697572-Prorocentrum_minimum.AAC.2